MWGGAGGAVRIDSPQQKSWLFGLPPGEEKVSLERRECHDAKMFQLVTPAGLQDAFSAAMVITTSWTSGDCWSAGALEEEWGVGSGGGG